MSSLMNRVVQDLVRDEGEVLHAYQDSLGFWTIGIGRLIDRKKGGGITHEEALYLLGNDIQRKSAELDRLLPWWRQLSENRQAVLLNMAFNLGTQGLLKFKRTLAAVQQGDYEAAAKSMLASKWARQVGERAVRLAKAMRKG